MTVHRNYSSLTPVLQPDKENDGSFRWIDGCQPAFSNYAPDFPQNTPQLWDCGQVFTGRQLTLRLLAGENGFSWAEVLLQAPSSGKQATASGIWATSARSRALEAPPQVVLQAANLATCGIRASGTGSRQWIGLGWTPRLTATASKVTWPASTRSRNWISSYVRNFTTGNSCSFQLKQYVRIQLCVFHLLFIYPVGVSDLKSMMSLKKYMF